MFIYDNYSYSPFRSAAIQAAPEIFLSNKENSD